jgi:mRNA-degrading endonuclease YafQ of YafQ-DinJ toxin-antitoxin module
VKYRFRTTPSFRKALVKLSAAQKQSALRAFAIFKADPFDPRLRTHKIHGLSVRYGRAIYSVWVEADVRAVFYLEGDIVMSVDIGTHAIYR